MSYRSNAAESWYPEPEPSVLPPEIPIDLLPPASLTRPLWKSLLNNLRDTFAPEKLPHLELTSRPVNVGLLLGDRLSLPWFRTVFTNLGDVISPETLPPLDLESTPVDVGELITWSQNMLAAMRALPQIADVASDLQANAPQINIAINRDQAADYARRKGWDLRQAEKWLAPNLGYEPED